MTSCHSLPQRLDFDHSLGSSNPSGRFLGPFGTVSTLVLAIPQPLNPMQRTQKPASCASPLMLRAHTRLARPGSSSTPLRHDHPLLVSTRTPPARLLPPNTNTELGVLTRITRRNSLRNLITNPLSKRPAREQNRRTHGSQHNTPEYRRFLVLRPAEVADRRGPECSWDAGHGCCGTRCMWGAGEG
jgi:hypothetical protein